jgi:transcriptional regulator with XRE-family HTH domain
MQTTDGPPTREQRFAAFVKPAAERAGYTGRGANANLARDAGIAESTISRMLNGQAIPDIKSFESLASALSVPVRDLLVEAEYVSATSLTETGSSQVRSATSHITPEQVADQFGIFDPYEREMLFGVIERLRRRQHQREQDDHLEDRGGAAAEG